LEKFENADIDEKGRLLKELKEKRGPNLLKRDRKELRKVYRKELVKRSILLKIAAAWVITVPAAGVLAAGIFFMLRGMLLP